MKTAYYEPTICMCTPENPNTMGVCVTLTEQVDGALLQAAVERLRERFCFSEKRHCEVSTQVRGVSRGETRRSATCGAAVRLL